MRRLAPVVVVLGLSFGMILLARHCAPRAGEKVTQIDSAPRPRPTARHLRFGSPDHDFGRVLQGDPAEHRFECEILAEVVIERIGASCGCLSSELQLWQDGAWEPTELPRILRPGTRAAVMARVDTSSPSARARSRLSVFSSDPDAPRLRLELSLELARLFALDPQRVVSPGFVRREGLRATVRLSPLLAPDVQVERIAPLPEGWSVQLRPDPQDRFVDLDLLARPPEGSEHVRGRVLLFCRSSAAEGARMLTLPVAGGTLPDVICEPSILMFPEVPRGVEQRFGFVLRAPDPDMPLRITSLRIDSEDAEALDVSWTVLNEARAFRIELLLGAERAPGPVRGDVVLTHDLSDRELRVRFAGLVGD